MSWKFGLCDLTGTPIGEITRAYERKLTLPLNGLSVATCRLNLADPLANEITSRNGDVMLKVYQGSTLRFIGELTTAEEVGEDKQTLACNFAGPLWRLAKRLWNKSAVDISTLTGERGQIAWALIEAANTKDWDTGIREGTIATTVNTTAGPWLYKPIAEALTEIASAKIYPPDPSFLAKDDFRDTAGLALGFSGPLCNLTRPALIGGLWSGAGDADDFGGGGTADGKVTRAVTTDATVDAGRYAFLNDTDLAGTTVQADISTTSSPGRLGVMARYQDTTHWLMASLRWISGTWYVDLTMCNGTPTVLGQVATSVTSGASYTIRLQVNADGTCRVWFFPTLGDSGDALFIPFDTALDASGPLATGSVGIYDGGVSGSGVRTFDNFFARRANLVWDEFNFGPGALTGRSNPMGVGSADWAVVSGSDSDDFFGEAPTGGAARRENFGDGNMDANLDTGRYMTLGAFGGNISGAIAVEAGVYMNTAGYTGRLGVMARCTDINNWVMAAYESLSTDASFPTPRPAITLRKRVGGTITTLGAIQVSAARSDYVYTIRLQIDATGTYAVWFWPYGGDDPAAPVLEGQDATLVGGSGAVGIYDAYITNDVSLRSVDGFAAWTPLQIMDWQGLDFEFAPVEPVVDNFYRTGDVKIADFNASTSIGTEKPEVIFEYGGGNRSAKSYQRVISRDGLVNAAYSLPAHHPEDTDVKIAVDLASKTARGLFEEVVSSDIGDASMRQSLVSAHARVRGVPRHIVTFEPSQTAPVFGTDYVVGDRVTARAIVNGVARLNALVRVYQVDISIDEEGKEVIVPVLTIE